MQDDDDSKLDDKWNSEQSTAMVYVIVGAACLITVIFLIANRITPSQVQQNARTVPGFPTPMDPAAAVSAFGDVVSETIRTTGEVVTDTVESATDAMRQPPINPRPTDQRK